MSGRREDAAPGGLIAEDVVFVREGLTLARAREQLDHWEGLGFTALETTYVEGKGFTVRCLRPWPSDGASAPGR